MYTARIKLPADFTESDIAKLCEALGENASAHIARRENNDDNGKWLLEWITPEKPTQEILSEQLMAMAEIQDVSALAVNDNAWLIKKIPDIDWLEHSYRQFQPFSVGGFFIYGSHYDGAATDGQISLQIDAATAFGSGEHGTTSGCLQAMQDLNAQGSCPWNVLDMGTGSGILAIAAWKIWKTPVLAVDNDEEAVRVTERHRAANKVPDGKSNLTAAYGDGFQAEAVLARKPFDLIIANIQAGPLKDMAQNLKAVADENGYVILSGILDEQAEAVLGAYEAIGFDLKKTYEIDGWSTLVLHHPPP